VEQHAPAGGEQAHDPVGDAELALAGQPADAEDLPLAHAEAHVPHGLPGHVHPEVLDRQQLLPQDSGLMAPGALGGHFPPDHPGGHVAHADPGDRRLLDHPPVAQHDQAVGHPQHFVQAVGDEDDGNALFGQVAQCLQEHLGLGLGEHRGGLVQHQDARLLPVDLARDLGELLVADRHLGHQHVGIQRDAQLGDGALRALLHVGPVEGAHAVAEHLVHEARPHGFPVQQDVLGGREAGYEAELLVHHADAGVERVEGALELHLFAVDADPAGVPAGLGDDRHAEEDAHQRGLAGAVLANQAEDFPRLEVETDVTEHRVAEEIFRNLVEREQLRVLRHGHP